MIVAQPSAPILDYPRLRRIPAINSRMPRMQSPIAIAPIQLLREAGRHMRMDKCSGRDGGLGDTCRADAFPAKIIEAFHPQYAFRGLVWRSAEENARP